MKMINTIIRIFWLSTAVFVRWLHVWLMGSPSWAERGEQTLLMKIHDGDCVLRWKKRRWRERRRKTFNTHTTIARWTFKPNRLGPSRASLGARVPCLIRSLSLTPLPMEWMDISSVAVAFRPLLTSFLPYLLSERVREYIRFSSYIRERPTRTTTVWNAKQARIVNEFKRREIRVLKSKKIVDHHVHRRLSYSFLVVRSYRILNSSRNFKISKSWLTVETRRHEKHSRRDLARLLRHVRILHFTCYMCDDVIHVREFELIWIIRVCH